MMTEMNLRLKIIARHDEPKFKLRQRGQWSRWEEARAPASVR